MADVLSQSPSGVPLRSPLQVTVEWSGEAGKALLSAARRLGRVEPLLPVIGRNLVNSMRKNILENRTPEGKAWPVLKRDRGPGRNPDRRALFDSGKMYDAITYRLLDAETVSAGIYDVPYAKFQNQGVQKSWTIRPRRFGSKLRFWGGDGWVYRKEVTHPGIPARTFVGMREGDAPDFKLILAKHVEDAFATAAQEFNVA
ncbi:MAG TPA: phage virion morphogenesis protein [Thermoanaerobaculia bacterium]|nr:phage virion morphogenesis protein [Thermoanaerobaculia bacterium]